MESSRLRELLADEKLKVVVASSTSSYRLEYYTVRFLGGKPDKPVLTRTYRLLDNVRGSAIRSPWDTFDLEKQVRIVGQLLKGGRYKIEKLIGGWSCKCESCGGTTSGKIWEPLPAKCSCSAMLEPNLVEDIEFR